MHLYLKSHSDGTILSFWLCKSTTWFLRKREIDSKWVIPNNEWIKKISKLLQTAPLTIFNFLLTMKVSYFSFLRMWKFHDPIWHERRIHPILTSFSVLAFLPLLQLLQCLNGYMCGHNLAMKFPPDFQNYTGLKGLVNSFS